MLNTSPTTRGWSSAKIRRGVWHLGGKQQATQSKDYDQGKVIAWVIE